MRLKEKRVIVTGASKNIGAKIAERFAKEGATVVLHYFKDKEGALSTKEKIDTFDGKSFPLQGDFGSEEKVSTFIEKAIETLGGVDVLVNCAGDYDTSHFLDLKRERFDSLLNVGVLSPVQLMQAVVKGMISEKIEGSIINISSISGIRTSENRCAHSSAKAALNMVTKSAALDLGKYGIRVNAICPGSIPYEGGGEYKAGGQAIQRAGKPEDIANAALFLAEDDSSWVTGHIMVVDGGNTISLSLG